MLIESGYPRIRISRMSLVLAAAFTLACGGESVSPPSMAGTYVATRFETVEGSQTTNVLALGGKIDLVLRENSTFTGHVVIPASVSDDELDVSFGGTWSSIGNVVRLTTQTDIFLRDLDLVASSGFLGGERQFAGVVVRVTLEQR